RRFCEVAILQLCDHLFGHLLVSFTRGTQLYQFDKVLTWGKIEAILTPHYHRILTHEPIELIHVTRTFVDGEWVRHIRCSPPAEVFLEVSQSWVSAKPHWVQELELHEIGRASCREGGDAR